MYANVRFQGDFDESPINGTIIRYYWDGDTGARKALGL
jgi:hypothetical protein